jgi:hypothetical protein
MVTPAPAAGGEAGLLADARALAGRLARASGAAAALVGGGLAAGLGHSASDIDIYLVGGQEQSRGQLTAGGRRIDVRQLPIGQILALAQRVAEADLTDDEHARPLGEADLILAVRLAGAEVAVGRPAVGPALDALDQCKLRKLTIGRWLGAALTALEDLCGLDERSEPEAAVLCARTALLAAGKAVAAGCGDLHDGVKWVFRQLRRSGPAGFPQVEFAALTRCDPLQCTQRSLADLLALAQSCLLAAATAGWQGVPPGDWPALAWTPGDGALHRAPGWYPLAFDRCVLAVAPAGRSLRIRQDVALIWALCNGYSQAVVTAEADRLRTAAGGYANLTASRCAALIDRVARAGLVRRG